MTLADVVYRIATDATFAARLQREPRETLATIGLTLDEEQIVAVLAVLLRRKGRWKDLCSVARIASEGFPWPPIQFSPQAIIPGLASKG